MRWPSLRHAQSLYVACPCAMYSPCAMQSLRHVRVCAQTSATLPSATLGCPVTLSFLDGPCHSLIPLTSTIVASQLSDFQTATSVIPGWTEMIDGDSWLAVCLGDEAGGRQGEAARGPGPARLLATPQPLAYTQPKLTTISAAHQPNFSHITPANSASLVPNEVLLQSKRLLLFCVMGNNFCFNTDKE